MEILDHLKSRKLRRGHLGSIEQDEFVEIIVSLLQALGGKASRQIILDHIYKIFGSQFRDADYALLTSQVPPKERWIHNIDWAKRKLVVKGYLQRPSDSPYGTWVLTEKIMKK
jgi:hypothetical protein